MANYNNETLEKALQQVLNSLAQAYLSLGKAYPEYEVASRSAFVQAVSSVARRHRPGPLPDAAIAFLTGLDAGEVKRLKDEPIGDAPMSAATQLIELWLAEASDSEGRPNPLPLEGPRSFVSLLGRTPSAPDLDEAVAALTAIGLAELREDMLYLNDEALPGVDAVDEAASLCSGVYPLLAAIGERRPTRRAFVKSAKTMAVREADVPRVRRVAESELRAAHTRVAELMSAYDSLRDGGDSEEDDDHERLSVSSGIFFVAADRASQV